MNSYLLQGGTVFIPNQPPKILDILIKGNKICRIAPKIIYYRGATVIPAANCGVLPGFIYEEPFWKVIRHQQRYRDKMVELIREGYTSFIDVIKWDSYQSFSQLVAYIEAQHYESPLDFTFKLLVLAKDLTPELLYTVGPYGIRHITIKVDDFRDLHRLDWYNIIRFKERYGIHFSLFINPSDKMYVKGKIEHIRNYWYNKQEYYNFSGHIIDRLYTNKSTPHLTAQHRTLHIDELISDQSRLPAQRAGIFPRKARIAPGSDADLIIAPLDLLNGNGQLQPKLMILGGMPISIPITNLPIGFGRSLYH